MCSTTLGVCSRTQPRPLYVLGEHCQLSRTPQPWTRSRRISVVQAGLELPVQTSLVSDSCPGAQMLGLQVCVAPIPAYTWLFR